MSGKSVLLPLGGKKSVAVPTTPTATLPSLNKKDFKNSGLSSLSIPLSSSSVSSSGGTSGLSSLVIPKSPSSPAPKLEVEEETVEVPGVPQSLRVQSTPSIKLPTSSLPIIEKTPPSLPTLPIMEKTEKQSSTPKLDKVKERKQLKESKESKENKEIKNLIREEEKGDVEKILAGSGFVVGEKILTKDKSGHMVCHFIKIRDNSGRTAYVELDTDCSDGLGYIEINENDEIMNVGDNSEIPYSLKMGTYEANNNDIYGVVFECNNSICVMSRKNTALEPVESVFSYENVDGDSSYFSEQPVSFPMIKMSEVMTNPKAVQKSVSLTYNRMRNAVFDNCSKESSKLLYEQLKAVEEQIQRFQTKSGETATALKTRINELENMLEVYERKGIKAKDEEKVRLIKFNLQKRHELMQDHMSLCHNIRSRANHLKQVASELKEYNDYAENLFQNLDYVFRE